MEEKKHCKWYNDEFCTNGDSPCVADYCPVVEYPELCKCRELDKDINVRSKTEEKKLTDEEVLILHEDNEEVYLSANGVGELIDEIFKEITEGKDGI